jgi:dolichyl-phosphate beta-glucosyltransferase
VAASRGEFVLFADADLSLPIDAADRFIAQLQAGHHVAIGSRALPDSTTRGRQQAMRRSLGKIFNWLVRRLMLPGLHDTQCGFKVFEGDIARSIFRQQTLDGFGFDVELLRIALRRGYRIVELPVACEYHASSSIRRVRHGAAMLRDLGTVVWRDWRGAYDEPR